jgi:hypothetical protein
MTMMSVRDVRAVEEFMRRVTDAGEKMQSVLMQHAKEIVGADASPELLEWTMVKILAHMWVPVVCTSRPEEHV